MAKVETKMEAAETAKPIEREVTITLTLKEAAEALGYLSGRDAWKLLGDYLDADPYEDVWHTGYSESDALNFDDPKGMDGAAQLFPAKIAIAAETAGRYELAAEITKERHRVIEQAFDKVEPVGEYLSADNEMISVGGTGISCSVDASKDEVALRIKNPEHLINDIVAGVGMYAPELDPHVAASDEEIKAGIIAHAGDYFEVYGDRKPEVSDRIDAGMDEDVYAEEAKHQIGEMTPAEIAEAVIDAVDAGRFESENEAIALAAKLTNESKADIAKAVKAALSGKKEKLSSRESDVAEESVQMEAEETEDKTYTYGAVGKLTVGDQVLYNGRKHTVVGHEAHMSKDWDSLYGRLHLKDNATQKVVEIDPMSDPGFESRSRREESVQMEAEEVMLHSTLKPDHYYVEFSKLPKEAQEKLKAAEVEIENSRYTVGEDMAFIRAEVEVNGKLWDAEISLGSVDIRHAGYEWDDEEGAYVDEDGRPIDSDEHAEYIASELAGMSELDHMDVYLDLIEELNESGEKLSEGKLDSYELYDIEYDTDGEEVSLPKSLKVKLPKGVDPYEDGADLISDKTGWLVKSFKVKKLGKAKSESLYESKAWRIFDWAGNLMFDGEKFESFEDAEEFLSEKLRDSYETDRQEYEIRQAEVRDARYLDPKMGGKKAAMESNHEADGDIDTYKFYVVQKSNGEIVSGWEYRQDAMDAAKELKEDGMDVKVLSAKAVSKEMKEKFHRANKIMSKIESTDLAVTVNGKSYGYVLTESKEMVQEATWLPRTLKPEHQELVSEVSNKLGYEVDAAMAFSVALLEDVNAHEEAAKVNAALTEVEEQIKLGEAKHHSVGSKVRIADLSGVDSAKRGTIVDRSEVKTNGRGIPTNVSGAYKPVNWSEEVAVRLDDGELITMFKERVLPADAKSMKDEQIKLGEAAVKKPKPLKEAAGDGPAVYVGTYGKYNSGSIAGKWLNLEAYASYDDFMEAAKELHKDEEDPELMFQDYQGFPKKYYSESSIDPNLWDWLNLDEEDRELLEVYIDEVNDEDATIDQARDAFMGKYDSERDWAMEFIDETGGLSESQAANFLYVDDVTAREIGLEDANARLEDMSDEEAVEEAGMEDEYDAATEDEKPKVAEKARDEVISKVSDEVEASIKKDAVGYFVDELGAYTVEELAKQSFVSIDYDAYARDARLNGDVSFVRKDGSVWVFANL